MACPFVMMELDGLRKSNGDVGTGLFNSLACAAKLRPTATILRQREANTLAEEAMAEEGRRCGDRQQAQKKSDPTWWRIGSTANALARHASALSSSLHRACGSQLIVNFSSSPQWSFTI
jgi:hypothetical protein